MTPTILVVMGVSGSGKSTVGAALAARLGWPFAEGDAFHSPEAVARMSAGEALGDADRWPWLARIGAWIDERLAEGESGVVACSALRRAYRDQLSRGRPNLRFIHLAGSPALIAARLAGRSGHFMPARLLDSQFEALEPPESDEAAINVDLDAPLDVIVARVIAALGMTDSTPEGEGRCPR